MTAIAPQGTDTRKSEGSPGSLTVCHVFSGDLWAGAEVMIFNLLRSLHDDGALRVIALSLNEGLLTEKLRAAGITTHVIPEARYGLVGIVRQAAKLLKNCQIAIIHSHRYKENVLAWSLARCLGVPEVVTTIHGLPEAATQSGREARLARLRTVLDYFVVRNLFSSAVAVSAEMKRVLVGRYGFREDRVHVIRNGARFPQPTITPRSRSEYFHIGTVGRIVPVKGLELFLEVAGVLRRETKFVRFSVLGDGPLRGELSRRAASLGISECVEFLAPRPDPFGYYDSLDLYLNTSWHEGLPLSVVEAMACGKPVVSSAVGGIPEIVVHGEHGFLVEGREANRFAERCLMLMRDDQLRTTMGERASTAARSRFSAGAMADAYRRLYGHCATRVQGRAPVEVAGGR